MHPSARLRLLPAMGVALVSFLLAACLAPPNPGVARDDLLTWLDVRPVTRPTAIGLLAPFEGLERRAGYAALAHLRGVIVEAPPDSALLPLALDTSRDPERAARKIQLEPSLAGLLGPLSPQQVPSGETAADLLALGAGRWLAPFALTETGFVAPSDSAWLEALLQGAARAAADQGATRLLVAGWTPAPGQTAREGFSTVIPIVWENGPHAKGLPELDAGDALLWLGSGAEAARALLDLPLAAASAPVWLAPWAADALFVEHLTAVSGGAVLWDSLYTLAWQDNGFAAWQAANPAAPPEEYALWAAVSLLVANVSGDGAPPATPESPAVSAWHLAAYRLQMTGERLNVND